MNKESFDCQTNVRVEDESYEIINSTYFKTYGNISKYRDHIFPFENKR